MRKVLTILFLTFSLSVNLNASVWIVLIDSTSNGAIDTIQHFLYHKQLKKYELLIPSTGKKVYEASLTKVPFTSPEYQYKMKGKGYGPKKGWQNGLQFELRSNSPLIQRDLSNCGGGLDFILVIKRKTKWYKKAEKMIIRMDLINEEYKLNIVFKPGIYFMSQLTKLDNNNNFQHPYDLTPKNWDKYKITKEQLYKVSRKHVTNPYEK